MPRKSKRPSGRFFFARKKAILPRVDRVDATQWGGCHGSYIAALLKSAGITQKEAARRLGLAGPRMLRHYIKGSYPVPYLVQLGLELIEAEEVKKRGGLSPPESN